MRIEDRGVLEFFLENGIIATMRNYHYTVGKTVEIRHNGKTVAYGRILAILENNETFQKILLKYSSFNDVKDWKKKAEELHGKLPKFIVVVKRISMPSLGVKKDWKPKRKS